MSPAELSPFKGPRDLAAITARRPSFLFEVANCNLKPGEIARMREGNACVQGADL
jgi:hypothetical protein